MPLIFFNESIFKLGYTGFMFLLKFILFENKDKKKWKINSYDLCSCTFLEEFKAII